MKYTYLGHASFLLESDDGVRIVTDPYPQSVMAHPVVNCDIVTLSHHHFDHCDLTQIGGTPMICEELAPVTVGSVRLYGIESFHDEVQGQKRGMNTIFVFEMDGKRLAHLGDLGHTLSGEQLKAIGPLDVLFVPVGGTFTLDPEGAVRVVRQLNPKEVVPMHFFTKGHSFEQLKKDTDFWAEMEKSDNA